MTQTVLQAVRRKRRLWRKYKVTKKDQDFSDYKKAEKKCKKAQRNAKRNYEKKLAKDFKTNPRAFYKYVNCKKSTRECIGPLKIDNVSIDSNKGMADALNSYFSSVFTVEDVENVPEIDRLRDDMNDLTSIVFHVAVIKKKMLNLKRFSAPGPDNFSPNLLINLAETLMYPLAYLFEMSFNQGEVPRDWRMAHVTPIFKKGAKCKAANYRPVSLTSVICKIMESVVRDEIVKHITKHDLILPSQHGFVSKRSCLTNLLEYLESVTEMVDKVDPVDAHS